jgi:hypothetical protein
MSSTSTAPGSLLQPHHVRNLIFILRRANTHYRVVASHIRATLRPTEHARKHAQRLGLKVNVNKAVHCDQKQVSVVPLPILDTTLTPVTAAGPSISSAGSSSGNLEVLRVQAQELKSSNAMKRRPILRCTIPGIITRTTPNGTTSAIALPSSTSDHSAITFSSPPAINVLGSKLVSERLTSTWSADGDDQVSSLPSDAFMNAPIHIPMGPAMQEWQPLDVPIDEEMDWGLDSISDMDVSPSSSPGSAGSRSDATSSTESSAGPTTPVSIISTSIHTRRS